MVERGNPEALVKELVGQAPWTVMLGAGSVLTLDFGVRDPRQSGVRIHGEWRLWLYECAWRLESGDTILTAGEHQRMLASNAVKSLRGVKITDLVIARPSLDLEITFENRSRLRTFATTASEDHFSDQWVLFTPQLVSVIARGDQLMTESYGHLTTADQEHRQQ